MRKLSADLMKAQRRQQADHRLRRRCGNNCEPVMLCRWGIGQPVAPPSNSFESAGANQATQSLSVDLGFGDFSPGYRTMSASEAKQTSRGAGDRHVAKCRHLLINVNVSPLPMVGNLGAPAPLLRKSGAKSPAKCAA
jgi:hypothetical protein